MLDGTVNLSTAAQLNYNANGSLSTGYAVDYVELDAGNTNSVRKGQNVFTGVNVGEKFNQPMLSACQRDRVLHRC